MWNGRIVSINIARSAGDPMISVEEAHAVPGGGLEGDRYFSKQGTYSNNPGTGREITLIETEAVEALKGEDSIIISPGDSRRNLVTRGVPLNHLVGKEFNVGEVRLRGVRLCEPCQHLAQLTQPGVLPGLIHRGGLRAEILNEGTIRVGDGVHELHPDASQGE
jgi:MOSC domain-containing protein YiiM